MNKPIAEALAKFGGNRSRLAAACSVTRQSLNDAISRDQYSAKLALAIEKASGVSAVRLVFGDGYARKFARLKVA